MVRIEFEYESRNFLKHMHPANGCDLIVCWRHNWPECPLEVIELRKVMEDSCAGSARFPFPRFATLNPDHRKEKFHCEPQDNL